jgi:penicillin-binding protein
MKLPLFAKFQKGIISLLILGLIIACTPRTSAVDPSESSHENPDITTAASAQAVAERFLEAWKAEDYGAMYRMLSTLSKDAITEIDFQNNYEDAANRLTLDFIDFQVLSTMAKTHQAEVAYRVDFNTRVFGVHSREMVMPLTFENNTWQIQWSRTLILPELEDGRSLEFVHQVPSRGQIFDRQGAPMAAYEDALAIGLVPREILPLQAALLYETLA